MNDFFSRNLDASLNRACEGLRVLMDLVRFGWDEEAFSEKLKKFRHDLVGIVGNAPEGVSLVMARDSQGDVSRPSEASLQPSPYHDLSELAGANFKRVEEALRSIEETLRLSSPVLARKVEYLRYHTYDLEKELHPYLQQESHKKKMDFELYVVTDHKLAGDRPLDLLVGKAIRGGAKCIQLREKTADTRCFLELARTLRKVTRAEGATFIVNDRIEIALEVEADGVHLGQEDLPLAVARRFSKGSLLIGISTHNPTQALAAQAGGADYVNLGPVFQTQTKGAPVTPVGIELIRELVSRLTVPFTTMGGIHLENVESVILAGADRIAVVSEVMAADDPEVASRKLLEAIHRAKEKRPQAGFRHSLE
jgi:thiamine-phosphate pyrophosphorylase